MWETMLEWVAHNRELLAWIGGGVSTLAAALWGVFTFFFKDSTAMRAHRTPIEREFPEPNYRERLKLFCDEIRDCLDRLDSETNWSHRYFVPLDAEVEVLKGDRRHRRLMDLFAGLRSNRHSRLFLVLGDPGAGKSVALRKLCRDLLREVDRTDKVPIYVNLREWKSKATWTRDDPPTEDQLRGFIFRSIREPLSNRSKAFLGAYFDRMLDHGRLFLVLDSFDEIPSVMDVGEASWLIGELSQVVTRLLVGGNEGRGVVASRQFRRPRLTREDLTILEIRPFSEVKIAAALDRATEQPDAVKRGLFVKRPELATIARNPFALGLMIDFWEAHPGQLPRSQAELYESFIARSLDLAQGDLCERNLTHHDVLTCASAIAREMFSSDQHGLEVPISLLQDRLPNLAVQEVVDFLIDARIGRRSARGAKFSFVHRRFAEYFLIDYFREQPDELPLESIPTNSRWRDALVLYAEVAEETVAKSLAALCWSEIRRAKEIGAKAGTDSYMRALHCLRFLPAAFRGRRNVLVKFEPQLADLTQRTLLEADDILMQKHALEVAGVLSDRHAELSISVALASGNPWLAESAFRACRYLPALPKSTKLLIMKSLLHVPPLERLRKHAEIMFSLQMSEGLPWIRRFYRVQHTEGVALLVGFLLSVIMFPGFALYSVFMSVGIAIDCLFGLLILVFFEGWRPRLVSQQLQSFARWVRWPIQDVLRLLHCGTLMVLTTVLPVSVAIDGRDLSWLLTVTSFPFVDWSYTQLIGEPQIYWLLIVIAASTVVAIMRPVTCAARLYLMIQAIRTLARKTFRMFTTNTLSVILVCIVFGVIIYGEIKLFQYAEVLLPVTLSLSGIVSAYFAIMGAHYVWQERKLFSQAKRECQGVRAQIGSVFLRFRTSLYRLKYARWLDARSSSAAFREKLASAENPWPDGQRPNVNNDAASILLAQLDERWLGLDR